MGPRFSLAVVVVFGLAVLIGVIAAKNQSQSSSAAPLPTAAPTSVPTPAPHHIDILPDPSGSAAGIYQPAQYTTTVGSKVTWTNLDVTDHSVTADNGAFNSDVLARGQSFSWTPKKPGVYGYGDFLHSDVTGRLVVKP